MHTEDEAKKMWCPHVRIGDEQGASASINRAWSRGCPDAASCIASKCMAWRWLRETPIRGLTASAESRTGIMIKSNDPKGPKLGYCGLAGKP